MAIQLKRNDTKDTISYTMTYADGTPVNLTGATVRFVMGKGKTLITSSATTIISAATGKVEYTLKESDTLVAGNFNAEFEVTFSDGKVKTFPSDGYISLRIQPNVDNDLSTYIEDQIAYRVSDIQILKNSIQAQLDQFAKGDSSPEVAQSRVEADGTVNTTLKARLDKKETKFASDIAALSTSVAQNMTEIESLETNKADKTEISTLTSGKADKAYVDTQIQAVATGSPKGVYATLAALQTAFPTGNTNIYLTADNGNWNYWNGTAWAAGGVYQSTGATDEFYKVAKEGYLSRNLFNKLTTFAGRLDANGNVNPGVTGYFTTDFIPVTAGATYISNFASGFVYCYNGSKTKVTSTLTNMTAGTPFVIPSGITYIRGSFVDASKETLQIESGSATTAYDGLGGFQFPQERIKGLISKLSEISTNANAYADKNATYHIAYTTDTVPVFTLTGTGSGATLTIKFPSSGGMFAVNNLNTNYKTFWFASENFVLTSGEVLYWNFDTNLVSKTKPTFGITLANFTNAIFKTGELLDAYQRQINNSYNSRITTLESDVLDSVPQLSESRAYVLDGFAADQGMDVVKEEIWVFRGSNAIHTDVANIEVYDKNTFTKKGSMTHNLGHCATASYSPTWDLMMTANGESDKNVLPRLDFLSNASTYPLGSNIVYGTPNVLSIEFFVNDGGGNVTKEIGGSGLVACFGEEPYVIYMIPYEHWSYRRIIKVLLGTGANDFSDPTGTDLTKWGTFISGKGENELNGTAKVVQIFTGAQYGTSQGMTYHDGKIFYGVSTAPDQCKVLEVVLLENGKFKCLKTYKYPSINKDGTYTWKETEGTAILDGRYLINGVRTATTESLVIFPLYNEQGGKGQTGQRVNFLFPCNSIPQVKITSTSNVTDLHVSSVDRNGFTVTSVGGGTGTFNWECKIS
jgi:hypothetical protein